MIRSARASYMWELCDVCGLNGVIAPDKPLKDTWTPLKNISANEKGSYISAHCAIIGKTSHREHPLLLLTDEKHYKVLQRQNLALIAWGKFSINSVQIVHSRSPRDGDWCILHDTHSSQQGSQGKKQDIIIIIWGGGVMYRHHNVHAARTPPLIHQGDESSEEKQKSM